MDIQEGYQRFRRKYALGDRSIMAGLSQVGQKPQIMVVACCDARVDPALILQCDPGDLFVVRNVANIVPPYTCDKGHHGVSAALEFGICFLKVKHLILLGHSQCGGIQALINRESLGENDFIAPWVSIINKDRFNLHDPDACAKLALEQSFQNCKQFPWIQKPFMQKTLSIHLWFFDIRTGCIFTHNAEKQGETRWIPL